MRYLALVQGFALFLASSMVASADAVRTLVPAGTTIPIHVLGDVSSHTAHEGDRFQIEVAHDVVVHGMVVVAANADGEGEITAVDHAGGNGHSGSLEMHFDWVHAVDGGKLKLRDTSQKQAEDDREGAKSTATIIGVATLGIGGLFGHNLAKGKEVTVSPKAILNAFVDRNVHVLSDTRAETDDQYDH